MKQPKKLTREQKKIMADNHYEPSNWMFVKESDEYLIVINKKSRKLRKISK